MRFQNGYVRVVETRLDPGQETHLHSHPIDAAVVFITDGSFRLTDDDGTVQESSVEAGSVAFGANAIVHRTANIGDARVRTIAVEVFSRPPANGASWSPSPGEILLDNGTVTMSRIVVGPGEAAAMTGAAPLVIVALSPGEVDRGGEIVRLDRGGACWCEDWRGSLRALGHADFEAIIVALKPRS